MTGTNKIINGWLRSVFFREIPLLHFRWRSLPWAGRPVTGRSLTRETCRVSRWVAAHVSAVEAKAKFQGNSTDYAISTPCPHSSSSPLLPRRSIASRHSSGDPLAMHAFTRLGSYFIFSYSRFYLRQSRLPLILVTHRVHFTVLHVDRWISWSAKGLA